MDFILNICNKEIVVIALTLNYSVNFKSVSGISTLLTIESPVAQWLEHPTRSRRVVGSNPIWGSDFSEVPVGSIVTISFTVYIILSHICLHKVT